MKYIVINHIEMVLFHCGMSHGEMLERLGGKCTSAGFVDLTTLRCHGESEGLGISSDPSDSILLRHRALTTRTLADEIKTVRASLSDGSPEALAAADRRLAGLLI